MRVLALALALTLGTAAPVDIVDINGRPLGAFAPSGRANALFFVMSDCPVSNAYAPEIQRACRDYRARGISCALIYEDVDLEAAAVRRHQHEYGYRDIPAAVDRRRALATAAGVSVTPSAVVIGRGGAVRYRGRIDNLYAALGKTRPNVTEPYLRNALDAVIAGRTVPVAETPAIGCRIVAPNVGSTGHASTPEHHQENGK
jgi:hypothetical protein